MKEKGILLPIFSLPSKYGIGDFGNEAYEFIDILSENGIIVIETDRKREVVENINTIDYSKYETMIRKSWQL